GENVAGRRSRAAQRVASASDLDTVAAIGDAATTASVVGAHIIAQHEVARASAVDQNAITLVGGDHIGRAGDGATDGVTGAGNLDTVEVGHALRSADGDTNEVVQHEIAAGAASQEHAIVAAAGDVVAFGQDGAANGVVGALHFHIILAI